MKRATLVLVPWLAFEGLPMTIIEGFACGVPVVASGIGSMGEMVRSGEAGVAFTTGDSETLSRLVEGLCATDASPDDLRRLGRQVYERAYFPDRHYQLLIDIQDDVRA